MPRKKSKPSRAASEVKKGHGAQIDTAEVSAPTLSNLLSVSEVQLGRLAAVGVILRTRFGKYDLWQSVRAYVVHLHQRIRDGRSAPAEHTLDLASAKIRETKERADKLSLDNARLRGDLVSVDQMVAILASFLGAARERIMASGLDPDEKERVLGDLSGLLNLAAEKHERNGNGASKTGSPPGSTAPVFRVSRRLVSCHIRAAISER